MRGTASTWASSSSAESRGEWTLLRVKKVVVHSRIRRTVHGSGMGADSRATRKPGNRKGPGAEPDRAVLLRARLPGAGLLLPAAWALCLSGGSEEEKPRDKAVKSGPSKRRLFRARRLFCVT